MTKKAIALLGLVLFLYACSTNKNAANKPLYEVLIVNNDGGANIKFYEVLTEPKEIMMLLGDETLKKKIKKDDTTKSSFVILNAGPTKESYNRIKIEKVIETATEIEVYIKDTQKNTPIDLSDENTLFPYTILKINSKKPIVFK
ncbi:protease complex subunit PrcB family protein [Flavobacterium sp. XGLA_31]|uniref:protease complex subunit PrcB family protein n=1 Tax=Flavobacterium sp. XGLA_31 TaxID=3447666 RepID=UPI003F36FE13